MQRKPIIAGNWKMNKNAAEGAALVEEIVAAVGQDHAVEVVVCPPFTALESVSSKLESSGVKLGAQNLYPEASGAYTGEISAEMLRHLFASYVILGHSERRAYFAEDDAFINRKVRHAIANQLRPILCVGETLEERDGGKTLEVVRRQLEGGLEGVENGDAPLLVIAYEPVWAIGTGKTATPEMAQEVHAFIRQILAKRFNKTAAGKIRILYGGSMKPSNAAELLAQADIDGGLIGGASLEAKSFFELIQAAKQRS
ncbi:MAG: triose-phosphate isomerase [Puniceicoccaceae bacterium]|nr:MAG: triose-phosphate isomerase [Puniceicoccaceae bacterium]